MKNKTKEQMSDKALMILEEEEGEEESYCHMR